MNHKEAIRLGRLAVWLMVFAIWLKFYETAANYLQLYRVSIALSSIMIIVDLLYQGVFGLLEDEDDGIARADNIIDIILFDKDQTKIETLYRKRGSPIPRVGETLVLDCGHAVEVVEVSYQRDEPNLVQIMTKECEQ